ncbi:MAG TPA: hypothetical protein VHT29_03680 [Solirubrobacteraceae bacterium]|nr:hypothetical protein [Solirubrobacteraceae bacterium]
MTASLKHSAVRLCAPISIAAGAVVLRLLSGVGFVNYDTLYALAWGGQLARGQTPAYGVAIAPTPHPLVEILGVVLRPLSANAIEQVTVVLAFLALSACTWVIYRLGAAWFGRAAGALAGLIFITRVPVLEYGVRAYVDVPYLLLVLSALLLESGAQQRRGRAAGWPVLALLALAGLLRPEAWAFSGLYWLYLIGLTPSWARRSLRERSPQRRQLADPTLGTSRGLIMLTLLAAAAPLVWIVSDLAITGQPLWSLTNTRHTASTLGRETGIAKVPEYIPRRIGEILRPPVLLGAAVGGVLSLLWLRRRALLGAATGVAAVVVLAAFASLGLPIDTRYAFLIAAILCVFCGAGVFGWTRLEPSDPRRRWWMAGGGVVVLALIAYTPAQYHSAHRVMDKLARQQSIEGDLVALVENGSVTLRCGPVGVPNHAPIPLLALYLETSPRNIVNAQLPSGQISRGIYVDPASKEVEDDYVLDPKDPHIAVSVPPGFSESASNGSWLIFKRCTG